MFFPRKTPTVLAFSALTALAVAVGCSREEDVAESGASDLTGGGALQDLVISQVYGGGGNNGATYTNDFVELFNQGDQDVEIAGATLQYVSSGASFTKTKNLLVIPAGTPKLSPGRYFLVQLATGAATGATPAGAPLTDVDYTATQPLELIAMSKESGKVALVAPGKDPLDGCGATGAECDPTKFLDLVGYGNASQFRGTAAVGALTTSTAAVRRFGGCAHAGDNSQDFEVLEPAPRTGKTVASVLCSTVDASAPPPPPPATDAGDAGPKPKSDAGTKTDGGTKPKSDAGTHTSKDGGSKTTTGDDDDDDTKPVDPGDGDDDDDVAPTKKPGKPSATTSSNTNAAAPPTFPATAPSCTTAPAPTTSFGGLGGIFGLALAGAALRRRSRL